MSERRLRFADMARAAGVLLLSAGAWACAPAGSLAGSYYCTSNSDCPAGQTCDVNSGYCGGGESSFDAGTVQGGHDAGSSGSLGGHDAGNPPPPPDAGSGNVGNTEYLCKSCSASSQCGGTGNLCLTFQGQVSSFCGIECNTDADCPSGNTCYAISGHPNNCFPSDGQCPGSTTTPPDAGTPPPPDAGTPPPPPDAGSPPPCTTDTWSNYASGFFNNYCNNCHYFADYPSVQQDESSIQSRIQSGSMPRGGGLPPSDKQRILKWMSCGLPQ